MWKFAKLHTKDLNRIFYLAKADLVKTYRGSALGWLWALIQPLIMVVVYWFVFRVGWKITTGEDQPDFFPWLLVGMVAWFFMTGMLSKGTRSLRNYSYLITKMKFPVSIIPTFVALSGLMVHLVLITLTMVFLALGTDHGVSVYWLQLPLYMLLMVAFFIAWSLFAAPLAVVSKDFANLVRSVTRVLFWLSAILWNIQTVNISWLQTVMLFNPISFFVEGYRKSLLGTGWFFEDWKALAAFGVMFVIMLVLAYTTFKRTRNELVDAL